MTSKTIEQAVERIIANAKKHVAAFYSMDEYIKSEVDWLMLRHHLAQDEPQAAIVKLHNLEEGLLLSYETGDPSILWEYVERVLNE